MESLVYQVVSASLAAVMLAAVLAIVYVSWRNGISPMPSPAPVRREVVDAMKRLPGSGVIVDAGSGWGTLALQAGRSCPGWQIIGIENSFIPMWISFLAAKLYNLTNVSFIRGDLYTYSYQDVDIVVCYLFPGAMKRLSPIFREQLAPETYIISICFALPDWEPKQVIACRDLYRTKVYIYTA